MSEGELLDLVPDLLTDFELSGFAKAPIDDAAFLLEEHYRAEGFAFATVDYTLPGDGRARFVVREGPRVRMEGYELEGVGPDRFGDVRAIIDRGLGLAEQVAPYSEARVEACATEVERYYRRRGFLDVAVGTEDPDIDPSSASATVRFVVGEGQPLWLASVEWTGDLVPGRDELGRLVAPFLAQPYTPRLRESVRGAVVEALRDDGRPDAIVEVVEVARGEEGAVRLLLRLLPGPEVRITAVRFVGNERTDASVLEARLGVAPGDLYRASRVRAGARRLYAMALFSEVQLRLEPEEGRERALVVELVEEPSVEVFVEPGYGSYELFRLRAGVVDRNAWGTGRSVRAEGAASFKALELELGLTDPALFGGEDVLDAAVTLERREEPSFEFRDLGLEAGVTRRWTDAFSQRLGYEFRRSDLLENDVGLTTDDAEEDFDLSSVQITSTYDTRDGVLDPTSGFQSRLSLELATEGLGSEVELARGVWSHAYHMRLGERTLLAARARVGVVAPIGETDSIPLQERFFLGGENSVRSFRESELGPEDADGDPTGGEAMSLLSLELRRRLRGRFEGALFFDTGNVVPDRTDFLEFDGYRHAVGVGLRYVLPVGPLRLDLGVNPNPRNGEDDLVLHVSVGRPF